MRQVEEALARQVIYGGDLVTNLLEVARVDEGVLTSLLAESMRLPPAPAGELPRTPDEVRSLVPREIALERTAVPLEIQADGKLVLAVAEPLPTDLAEQLRFALGMGIEQRAAPAVRVHQAMARAYGVPLDRRMLRLIARLGGDSPEAGSTPPPLGMVPKVPAPPRPPSGPPGPGQRPATSTTTAAVAGRLAPKLPGHRITNAGFPAAPAQPAAAGSPSTDASGVIALAPDAVAETAGPPAASPPAVAPAPSPAPAPVTAPVASPPPEVTTFPSLTPTRPGGGVNPPAPAPAAPGPGGPGEVHSGLLQRQVSVGPRPMRRRRGPITVEAARAEADEVVDRDALLDLFFDFSQQFFDYSALFLVHGDIAEGRDAFGNGASRERVLGIGVPLDMPSMLSGVRDKRLSAVAKPPADSLDASLLSDLQRSRTSEMVIVPLVVRTRAVALLIGDCGEAGIDKESVQQVVSFSGVVGKSFERIIVRRKLDGFIAGGRDSTVGRVSSSMVPSKPPSALGAVPSRGLRAPLPRPTSRRARRPRSPRSPPPPHRPVRRGRRRASRRRWCPRRPRLRRCRVAPPRRPRCRSSLDEPVLRARRPPPRGCLLPP